MEGGLGALDGTQPLYPGRDELALVALHVHLDEGLSRAGHIPALHEVGKGVGINLPVHVGVPAAQLSCDAGAAIPRHCGGHLHGGCSGVRLTRPNSDRVGAEVNFACPGRLSVEGKVSLDLGECDWVGLHPVRFVDELGGVEHGRSNPGAEADVVSAGGQVPEEVSHGLGLPPWRSVSVPELLHEGNVFPLPVLYDDACATGQQDFVDRIYFLQGQDTMCNDPVCFLHYNFSQSVLFLRVKVEADLVPSGLEGRPRSTLLGRAWRPPEVHGLGRREEHHRRILASAASHRLGRDLHEGDGGGKDASAKQNIIWRHGYGFRLSSFCVHTAMENSTCLTWTKL